MTQTLIPPALLSRDLALRIGLAARALPETDPARLVEILISCVGVPLTSQKLARLEMQDLKHAVGGELADVAQGLLAESLRLLKENASRKRTDQTIAEPPAQKPKAYPEGKLPGFVRVACASNTGELLDGHFGSCTRFLVYQVSPTEIHLIDVRSGTGTAEGKDKTAHRVELIRDCHVLYVLSIGGPAAAKVVNAGVHPVKLPQGRAVREILDRLQNVLAEAPPPWLAKAMRKD
jgi:nitrogen fixation protein NifX